MLVSNDVTAVNIVIPPTARLSAPRLPEYGWISLSLKSRPPFKKVLFTRADRHFHGLLHDISDLPGKMDLPRPVHGHGFDKEEFHRLPV